MQVKTNFYEGIPSGWLKKGCYCKECNAYYTYRQWDNLKTELVYPDTNLQAVNTICSNCGNHLWWVRG